MTCARQRVENARLSNRISICAADTMAPAQLGGGSPEIRTFERRAGAASTRPRVCFTLEEQRRGWDVALRGALLKRRGCEGGARLPHPQQGSDSLSPGVVSRVLPLQTGVFPATESLERNRRFVNKVLNWTDCLLQSPTSRAV